LYIVGAGRYRLCNSRIFPYHVDHPVHYRALLAAIVLFIHINLELNSLAKQVDSLIVKMNYPEASFGELTLFVNKKTLWT
jgi:hypothetical protein